MASQAQFDANRLNAQKSSGPASAEGKSRSRFNALKHRAYAAEAEITGEDIEAFAAREKNYFDFFNPQTPVELMHVKALIDAENEMDRCILLENCTLKALKDKQPETSANPLGDAMLQDSAGPNAIPKIARRRTAAYNRWVRSYNLLTAFLEARAEAEALPEEQPAAQPEPAPPPRQAAAPPAPQPVAVASQPQTGPQPVSNSGQTRKTRGWTGNEPPSWRL